MKLCFVVMGFGKKSDPSTGKTLDLDQTYKNIIKPAAEMSGYTCVRADEIQESGLIDKSMYALLMQAELVIADISTYNPNAIYELGIRHAVKPFSTIILKEREGKIPFDLDHTRMFTYSHLGEDIGTDESERCIKELSSLIENTIRYEVIDSPLYEYIKNIAPPILPEEEYTSTIKDLADREKHIFAIVENAQSLMRDSSFKEAARYWERASLKAPAEPYFVQQRALCVYKSKQPSPHSALIDALGIINTLEPDGHQTNDPETLGITGAIYKNLWLQTSDSEYLIRAINYYGKCYKIRNDYYTGENYALCLNMKEQIDEGEEKIHSRIEARNTRKQIISTLEEETKAEGFDKRADRKWVFATLSQCLWALDDLEHAEKYENLFLTCDLAEWEKQTFYQTRVELKKLLIK